MSIIIQMTNSIYLPFDDAKEGEAWEEKKKLFLRIDDRICHRRMRFGLHKQEPARKTDRHLREQNPGEKSHPKALWFTSPILPDLQSLGWPC